MLQADAAAQQAQLAAARSQLQAGLAAAREQVAAARHSLQGVVRHALEPVIRWSTLPSAPLGSANILCINMQVDRGQQWQCMGCVSSQLTACLTSGLGLPLTARSSASTPPPDGSADAIAAAAVQLESARALLAEHMVSMRSQVSNVLAGSVLTRGRVHVAEMINHPFALLRLSWVHASHTSVRGV